MSIDQGALHRILAELPFEAGRWVVAGSAPMLMAGLIDSITDVDIVVDGIAWRQAVSLSDEEPRDGLFGDRIVELDVAGSPAEIFDGWLGIEASVLIAEASMRDGYPFSPLTRVLESKRRLSRPKDLAHIEVLEAHLTGGPTAASK